MQQSGDGVTVTAESRAAAASGADDAPQVRTYHPDLVVAADGSMSQTRQRLRPNEGRRQVPPFGMSNASRVLDNGFVT